MRRGEERLDLIDSDGALTHVVRTDVAEPMRRFLLCVYRIFAEENLNDHTSYKAGYIYYKYFM